MDISLQSNLGSCSTSPPHMPPTDQMSKVIRYVIITNNEVVVNEIFLGIFPITLFGLCFFFSKCFYAVKFK